jgi:DNA-binding response OmpR family regulator
LLVDDDRLPMQFYVKALKQKGFRVEHYLEPDSALSFVEEKSSEISAIILDIMMPPGKAYKNEDTNEGLRTGLYLFSDIRKHCPHVPVIILTNVKNPITLAEFTGQPLVKVVQKMECPPFELTELVGETLGICKSEMDSDKR